MRCQGWGYRLHTVVEPQLTVHMMAINIWMKEYNVTSHQGTTAMAEEALRLTTTAARAWGIRNIDVSTRGRESEGTLSGDLS